MTLLILLIILNLLNIADGIATRHYLINTDIFKENNPLILLSMDILGITWGIIIPKMIVPIASVAIFQNKDHIGNIPIFIGLIAAIGVYFSFCYDYYTYYVLIFGG